MAESKLQRLVRVGEEKRYAWALYIHGMEPGPDREMELTVWAEVTGGTLLDVEGMVTCECEHCVTRRAGAADRLDYERERHILWDSHPHP
ncbi:hypothetical protein ACWEP8_38755 [Streptomyces hydrogenans]